MAYCKVAFSDEFARKLEKIESHMPKIVDKMLVAGGRVVLETARVRLNQAVKNSSDRSTGQLKKSLGMTRPTNFYPNSIGDDGSRHVHIGFAEPRCNGTSNALVANVLEYGKKRQRQAPRPFMRPAEKASKKACETAMADVFEREIKKLGG